MTYEPPFVSIVMPVRNEADFIAESLGAVLAQDYSHDRLEVLIADGMSSDGTRTIIQQVAAQHPDIPVVIYDNPTPIVSTGMNVVIDHARGTIIVRVDGHCRIAPDYISCCVAHLQRGGVDCVGGSIKTLAATPTGQAIALAMSSRFGVGGSAFRTVQGQTRLVDTVPFAAYTRQAIEQAGPFDETLKRNQDDEYNYRLRKLGAKILLAADVRSEYYSRASLKSLWKQYYEYGFYKVRVMQKHPRQMRLRQFVPPLFVLALIGGGLLALFVPIIRWLWIAMLASYLLSAMAATIHMAGRGGWRHALVLPLAFAILHVSYGLGFLIGLVHFIGWWGKP